MLFFAFREIQRIKKEQSDRQLFEVIEWATSVREWDFTEADNARLKNSKDTKEAWINSWIIISHHIELLMSILRTGHIMDKVSERLKRPTLNKKIKSLMTELIATQSHLIGLQKCVDITATKTPDIFIAALDRLNEQQAKLRQAAEDVVTVTAKLL